MTEDDVILAAELVLGLLDGDVRRAAEQRVFADPAFAEEVARWHKRLAGFFAEVPEATPATAFDERRLAGAANDNGRGWRTVAIGAGAVAAAALLWIGLAPTPPAPEPRIVAAPRPPSRPVLVAALSGEDHTAFAAYVSTDGGTVRIIGAGATPDARSVQLWAIGADATPRPLGLVPVSGSGTVRLATADRAALRAGVTLAISLEPTGGSPTGQPTGPVLATGALHAA